MLGLERSLGARIVTYADDLVILCRKGKAEEALQRLREIMGKLKLTVNEEKTRNGRRASYVLLQQGRHEAAWFQSVRGPEARQAGARMRRGGVAPHGAA